MADGRNLNNEVPYHNNSSYQQNPTLDGHSPQSNVYTRQSSEMQQPMTKSSTNSFSDMESSQMVGLSKSSSTMGDEELFGEKILQNRHVAFPPSQTPNSTLPNSTSHLQTILPQTAVSQHTYPQHSISNVPQQLNTNSSCGTDNDPARGVQRNNSIPNVNVTPTVAISSHDIGNIPHPPISPSHDSTRMMSMPVNAVPVSIAVDMTLNSSGQQQVVTKKKGRFKFVEQVPSMQRTSNENLMNEGTAEQRTQQHAIPVNSLMPSSSNGSLQGISIPQQSTQSTLPPPSGPPEIQPHMVVTTPSVQKKGRFVVTTLPTPVALSNGSIPASNTQHQVHSQQPVTEQIQHQDVTHVRRPSDDITNTSTNMAIQYATQYIYPTSDGIIAPVNGPMISSYPPPPPPPPQAVLSTGQSPGHTVPHPNSNSENNSPITSQASSSYVPNGGNIIDDSMVQAAAAHYETIQGSSLPSSRQVSPKVVSKPVASRHNTTGMTITTTNGTTNTTSNNSNMNSNSSSSNNNNSGGSSYLLAAPSQRLQQQQQQQQPGFGKMLYFLDQMKLEVTEADQSIKNLHTEMKCLVR